MSIAYYKHPRIFHFPWSGSISSDDKIIISLEQFKNRRVIVTKKMDGENTSLYRDHTHARSIDSLHHVSRDWIKQYWSTFRYEIPEHWRLCGENLYAKHSIHYHNLKSYFYGFSVWDGGNVRLNWNDTLEWFNLLNIQPVEVMFDGYFNEDRIYKLQYELDNDGEDEGFVMTVADELDYAAFSLYTAKYVRPNHVRSSSHWKSEEVIRNELG